MIRNFTNLFKNTNIKITFCTNNTIYDILKTHRNDTNTLMCSGIYQLPATSPIQVKLVNISNVEHIRYINSNNPPSAYALHILHDKYEYRPMNITMSLFHPVHKSQ